MNFAEPSLLWLALAAPVAAVAALWLQRRRATAEAAWASRAIESRLRSGSRPRRPLWAALLLGIATLGIVLALARPRWGESIEQIDQRGVDIVFVVDTSASMGTYDVLPSRIWVAQSLVRRLAQQLPGNRVALVQAEGVGVVMAPLTVDIAVLDLLLDVIEPGSLPLPGTQFAPALRRAIDLFPAGHDKQRVVVLLSDGEDHDEPLGTILDQLVEAGIVVHTVGVGTTQGARSPLAGVEAIGLEQRRARSAGRGGRGGAGIGRRRGAGLLRRRRNAGGEQEAAKDRSEDGLSRRPPREASRSGAPHAAASGGWRRGHRI